MVLREFSISGKMRNCEESKRTENCSASNFHLVSFIDLRKFSNPLVSRRVPYVRRSSYFYGNRKRLRLMEFRLVSPLVSARCIYYNLKLGGSPAGPCPALVTLCARVLYISMSSSTFAAQFPQAGKRVGYHITRVKSRLC